MKQFSIKLSVVAICFLAAGCSNPVALNDSSFTLHGDSAHWKIDYTLRSAGKNNDDTITYTETYSIKYKGSNIAGVSEVQIGAMPTFVYCGQILGGRDRLPSDGVMKDERTCSLKQIDKSQKPNIYISWQDQSIADRSAGEDIILK